MVGSTISRRRFVSSSAAAAAAALAGAGTTGSARGDAPAIRPSVLLLMTDQHTARALSCRQHPHIRTPNLDRLAAEGVIFENALCTYPVCTASRASIVTGRWPHVQGPHLNVGAPERDPEKGLPPDTVMTESILHDAGSRCSHHGKWHLGSVTRHSCYAGQPGIGDYHPLYGAARREWQADHPVDAEPGDAELYGWPLYMTDAVKRAHEAWDASAQDISLIGRMALPLEIDKTTWVTDCALDELAACGDDPFMLTWSVDPPHAFWAVQEPYYSAVDLADIELPANSDRPSYLDREPASKLADALGPDGMREYLRCYYGLVMQVDDQVGRIISRLEAMGRLDSTIVIFTSDHGDMNGAHRSVGKGTSAFSDEVVGVPLIVRYPTRVPAGLRRRTHVSGVDVMPTILGWCGPPVPEQCQGTSLSRYIEAGDDMERIGFSERTHPTAQAAGRMIRTHEWKLAANMENWSTDHGQFALRAPVELFNLTEDPGEVNNLSDDPAYASVRADMAERLLAWMDETDDAWLAKVPSGLLAPSRPR